MRSLTMILDSAFIILPLWLRILIILLFLVFLAVISKWRGFLTLSGTLMAVVLGFIVFFIGNVSGIAMFLFFFLSSSLVSRIGKSPYSFCDSSCNSHCDKTYDDTCGNTCTGAENTVIPNPTSGRVADSTKQNPRKSGDSLEAKGNSRDWLQVLANGLPAALALILFRIAPFEEALLIAFASAIAEAESDTFASSIGKLSHDDPVSIVTFTKVPKGISGGVTVLGFASALFSSFLIAILFMGTFGCSPKAILIIGASGFLGCLLDSFLGATLQVAYRDGCGRLTERKYDGDRLNERVRGIPFIDNDMVNLLSGLFSMLVGFSLSRFL